MELTDERIVFSAGHLVDVDPLDRTRLRELVRRPFTRRELHELDLEPNNPSTSRSVSGRISASPRTSRALRGRRSYGCSPPASGGLARDAEAGGVAWRRSFQRRPDHRYARWVA